MSYTIDKSEIIDYTPEHLRTLHLYMYEWIDNLHFTIKSAEVLEKPHEYIQVVREIFLEAGWYGDGDIELMWIPPFMLGGKTTTDSTKGVTIWHVKQKEDGLSWILSPIEIPFP
ncbi:MAG: hypothetical protein Roseis2KO_10110 [Roseivirga sp.]